MNIPDSLTLSGIKELLKKVGGLIRPKRKERQKSLYDSSTHVKINGDNNLILVYPQTQKEPFITSIDNIPPEVITKIIEQFKQKDLDINKEGIRLINSDEFRKDINDYADEFYKPSTLDDIILLLEDKYQSIFKLSIYIERLLRTENHEKVKKIKLNINKQYGKEGTKLCRLYLTGYLNKFIKYFSMQTTKKNIDKKALSKFINKELRDFIEDSKYLFFIQKRDNIVQIAHKIVNQMENGTPFIAVHASGFSNIRKAKKILKIIKDEIENCEYKKKVINDPIKCSDSPIYYVALVNKKSSP